jgi:hypothetical protein
MLLKMVQIKISFAYMPKFFLNLGDLQIKCTLERPEKHKMMHEEFFLGKKSTSG